MSNKASHSTSCYHCGDPCKEGDHHFDEKSFCCRGCKTVYEILSSKDLVEYYAIESNPGIKKEDEAIFSDFSFLDIPEIRKDLLTFSAGGIESVTLGVPSVHCSSCIWLLENLHSIHKAVLKSEVNFLKKEVFIQYKAEEISLRKVAELLDSIGYKPLVELEEKERSRANKQKDLSYIYKLGISGFAFGNIMLLSFPEYFSGGMYSDGDFGKFFGFVNLLLALPVFFYCSASYFSSAWKGLKVGFLNIDVPISLGILVLFLRSSYEVISMTGAGYFDSMTGLVFFLLVGRWFQNRTYQALSFERDYRSYFPLGVTRIKGGEKENVLLKEIKVDDEIVIHNGEIIPADALLVKGRAHIDYSFVTGESDPVSISLGEKLYAGGRQKGEQIQVKIEKEFSQSYLMQLWKYEVKERDSDKGLGSLIDKVSQYFTAIILLIAFGSGVYWWVIEPSLAFHAIGSVLIIACPCALALTIPFTFGNGMRLLEKAGMYLRDARFIEVLSQVDTIVFDKTGTITTQNNSLVSYEGTELGISEKAMVKALSENSAHPLSRMITSFLEDSHEVEIEDFIEVEGKGLKGIINGKEILLGSAEYVNFKNPIPGTVAYLSIDGLDKGYFKIKNDFRKGLKEVVQALGTHCEIQVITGDGDSEKANLEAIFGKNAVIKFKMDPFDKLQHILELRKKGKKVLMIGDGLNDAGAIRESNMGISISDDIFGFLPSCDAILEATSFNQLPNLLTFSGRMKRLVVVGFIISFLYNIVGLSFAVQGILSPVVAAILMPLSSISVVSFAIFSTNYAARKNNIF